ncbi:tetratricopeptide repeat protein [Nonomuraea basaltis]|nr:tetratricopeptide repeat protein [Nonomuraea basaltis]
MQATIRNNRVHVYYRQGRMDDAVAEARAVGTTLHDLGRHGEARRAWRESLMLL